MTMLRRTKRAMCGVTLGKAIDKAQQFMDVEFSKTLHVLVRVN